MTKSWATIEDVAEAAGVSTATVSRALRDLPHVAPSTRRRVRTMAEALDYRPHPSAASLAAGRTQTVAMAVPMLDSWYFARVMAGAEAVLSSAGYDLLLSTVAGTDRRRRLLDGPFAKRVDGLILVDLRIPEAEVDALLNRPVRVVTVGIEIAGASSVVVDDLGIAEEAVNHLIELGHHKIALIEGSPGDPMRFTVPDQRRLGYLAALEAAGIEPQPDYRVQGHFSIAGGRRAMAELLDLPDRPTSVFAMSDEMAFGAMDELGRRGLQCPRDISMVGVDDHEFSEVIGLTTVGQEVTAHGALAATILLDELQSENPIPRRRLAETALIPRRTTGAPAAR